nr:hypothetical protein [Mycobacterium alsense]
MDGIPVSVVRPGEGDVVGLPGFGAVFKLSSSTNGGEVSIVEHPFAVGVLTAAHRHTHEDEHSIVLAGEIGFRSPRGQMHAMWNAGSVPGRIVETITPGGFENYSGTSASCSSSAPTTRWARCCTSCPSSASSRTSTGSPTKTRTGWTTSGGDTG